MQIIDYRPEQERGNCVARFDIEWPNGVRNYNLKLADTPRGLRVYAPSAFGRAAVSFPPEIAAAIITEVTRQTGAIAANDTSYTTR